MKSRTFPTILLNIFVPALAIRWTYDLVLYWTMGERGLLGIDSQYYLRHCNSFAEGVAAGSIHGWQWLGLEPVIMPLATWMISINILLFGSNAPIAYVLSQGIVDATTCLIILRLAQTIDKRFATAAGLAACVNPTQIVLAGIVYTDTLFIFFVALFLLGAVRWLRDPSWLSIAIIGIGLVGSALTRIIVAPWIPALGVFLLICIAARRCGQFRQQIVQVLTMTALAGICLGAISMRNATLYGSWSLTPQTGYHTFGWIVPLVKEAQDGTPWAQTYDQMIHRRRELYSNQSSDSFDESRQFMTIAKEELANLRFTSFIKAWAFGATINLASPAIILSPPVLALPKTGFYATTGGSLLEKAWKFLFHSDNAIYAWVLNLGVLGVAAVRIIQLRGLMVIAAETRNFSAIFLFGGWIAFILLANGPIGSAKYRLPIEPVLTVLTGAGWCALRRRHLQKLQLS